MIAEATPDFDDRPGATCPHCHGWVYDRGDGIHCDGCGQHRFIFRMDRPLTAERIRELVNSPMWGLPGQG